MAAAKQRWEKTFHQAGSRGEVMLGVEDTRHHTTHGTRPKLTKGATMYNI